MTTGGTRAKALADGRRADSARRRQRVIAAINRAATDRTEISVSAIARAAVDRTFLYRHRDLLGQIHATQAGPPGAGTGPAVTRASLQADLLAAHQRALRLTARIQQLETRLSEALGDQAWRESGLGAPAGIDVLNHKIANLDQQVTGLRLELDERDSELAAARAANRNSWPGSTRQPTAKPVTTCTTPVVLRHHKKQAFELARPENSPHMSDLSPRERTPGLAHPHLQADSTRAVGSAPLHWRGLPCGGASCPGPSRRRRAPRREPARHARPGGAARGSGRRAVAHLRQRTA